MNDMRLFAFEADFVATLRCVPMAVRFKLDLCLVKLSLRQWSRFTPQDRQRLLLAPCDAQDEVETYRELVVHLIAQRAGGRVEMLAEPPARLWAQDAATPSSVRAFALSIDLRAPSDADWSGLTRLERFALLKLSRDNHDNVNFIPALQEFGLPTEHTSDGGSREKAPRNLRAARTVGRR